MIMSKYTSRILSAAVAAGAFMTFVANRRKTN